MRKAVTVHRKVIKQLSDVTTGRCYVLLFESIWLKVIIAPKTNDFRLVRFCFKTP